MSNEQQPISPKECAICYDDLDSENAIEYQIHGNSVDWFPSHFCQSCTSVLQTMQFQKYCHDLATTACAREQKALLEKGPPINLHDKNGFPMAGETEITRLRHATNKQEISAKLVGALEGDERKKFWEEQKHFIIKNEEVEHNEK